MPRFLAPIPVALVLLLSGCATLSLAPDPTRTHGKSTEDQLVVARDAYLTYIGVVDQILADGGHGGDRLAGVVSTQLFDLYQESFVSVRSRELRAVGATTAFGFALEQVDGAHVTLSLCVDSDGKDLVDAAGAPVSTAEKVGPRLVVAELERRDGIFVVTSDDPVAQGELCQQ